MKRIALLIFGLLCLSTAALAQQSVPSGTALDTALADINAKLGTSYTLNGGQLAYQYNEARVTGDNLGCPNIAATNQNSYMQMTTRFDLNFDSVFEWEYRFAYEADGSLKTVICAQPDPSSVQPATTIPTTAPTLDVTAEGTPAPVVTPAGTQGLEPIYGRDGARILPLSSCGGADNALMNRLVGGGTGRVIPGGAANNLRQAADQTSAKIGEIASGATFTVMDGPFCNGNIAWYLVGDGITPLGWTAEGNNGEYFLEPTLTNAAPIEPANAINLANIGGIFAPDTRTISANSPVTSLLASNGETIQLWQPTGGFTTLETLTWEVATEFTTPHQWLFVDNTGRQWGADVTDGGALMLLPLNDAAFSPYTQQISGRFPVVAVDNESNFAAVADGETVTLVGLTRDGTDATVIAELPQPGNATSLAFGPDGLSLYVAADNQFSLYRYELGEGWQTEPALVIANDVVSGVLAVDESGDRVALSSTADADESGIWIYTGLNMNAVTTAQFMPEDGVDLSRPAFNARGTLLAVYAGDNTVRLFDTAGQPVASLPVGDTQALGTGTVAFSRDGLVLWVASDGAGVQAFAIAD